MQDWQKFNDTSLPKKDDFYSGLSMEDITDSDYNHARVIFDDFEIKQLGEYHDLNLKSDKLLLADNFKIFRKMFLEISIRLCIFFFSTCISMATSFREEQSKIRFIN